MNPPSTFAVLVVLGAGLFFQQTPSHASGALTARRSDFATNKAAAKLKFKARLTSGHRVAKGVRSDIKVPGFQIRGSLPLVSGQDVQLKVKVEKKNTGLLARIISLPGWNSFTINGRLTHKIRQTFSNRPRVDVYTFSPNQKGIEMLDYSFDQLSIELHLQNQTKNMIELVLNENDDGERLHLLGPRANVD